MVKFKGVNGDRYLTYRGEIMSFTRVKIIRPPRLFSPYSGGVRRYLKNLAKAIIGGTDAWWDRKLIIGAAKIESRASKTLIHSEAEMITKETAFDSLKEIDPEKIEAQKGNMAKAMGDFEFAIKYNPDFSFNAHYGLASTHFYSGTIATTLSICEKIITEQKELSNSEMAQVLYLKGNTHKELGEEKSAASAYQEAYSYTMAHIRDIESRKMFRLTKWLSKKLDRSIINIPKEFLGGLFSMNMGFDYWNKTLVELPEMIKNGGIIDSLKEINPRKVGIALSPLVALTLGWVFIPQLVEVGTDIGTYISATLDPLREAKLNWRDMTQFFTYALINMRAEIKRDITLFFTYALISMGAEIKRSWSDKDKLNSTNVAYYGIRAFFGSILVSRVVDETMHASPGRTYTFIMLMAAAVFASLCTLFGRFIRKPRLDSKLNDKVIKEQLLILPFSVGIITGLREFLPRLTAEIKDLGISQNEENISIVSYWFIIGLVRFTFAELRARLEFSNESIRAERKHGIKKREGAIPYHTVVAFKEHLEALVITPQT